MASSARIHSCIVWLGRGLQQPRRLLQGSECLGSAKPAVSAAAARAAGRSPASRLSSSMAVPASFGWRSRRRWLGRQQDGCTRQSPSTHVCDSPHRGPPAWRGRTHTSRTCQYSGARATGRKRTTLAGAKRCMVVRAARSAGRCAPAPCRGPCGLGLGSTSVSDTRRPPPARPRRD